MATPISIAEEARDITIGLDINDRMCVFAAQGAARLEDQFSSEALMVPQLGEFFLSGEKLSAHRRTSRHLPLLRAEAANQQTPISRRNRNPRSPASQVNRAACATGRAAAS